MGHAHGHAASGSKLAIAFFLSFGILAVLLVGGYLSHSLALMADAGHVVTDIAALGLSWFATRRALKPADETRTFGYHRTGILAALANAVSLILIAVVIAYEAYRRFFAPPEVATTIMMASAALGLLLNLGIGLGLKDASHENLNVRSAFLHVMGDAAASAGVIVGAIAIHFTGWYVIDPLLSVAIALFIAYSAWQVVEETLHILMEGVPKHLDVRAIKADLAAADGVRGVHEMHVWSLAEGMTNLSCHLVIADERLEESTQIVKRCTRVLADKYGITHTTIQAEAEHCSPDETDCSHVMEADGHDHAHDHEHSH